MGNRSDRRLANLANPLALEAVVPIRTRRADSIMARSKSQSSSQRPHIRMQPELPLIDQRLATGAGSIYEGSNPSLVYSFRALKKKEK